MGCEIWSAQWNAEDNFKGRMWQYTDALNIGGKNFNGNILYEASSQAVLGQSTQAPAQPVTTQTTANLIQNILASHSKDDAAQAQPETQPTPKPPSANSSAAINSILSNIRPQAGATKSNAQPSADDKIKNILANARNKK